MLVKVGQQRELQARCDSTDWWRLAVMAAFGFPQPDLMISSSREFWGDFFPLSFLKDEGLRRTCALKQLQLSSFKNEPCAKKLGTENPVRPGVKDY
ncbi:hypothetical protein OJAV_G00007610 [Oryzias javanicus]|uniref:Uncharacterized protein n=1 Tax=Oryzias javanicus TaxID=123683 RepID=A0A437DMK4_ORYJA|nr:hypothetical protein OJAV_G00007610 [Oryzias javanicus]